MDSDVAGDGLMAAAVRVVIRGEVLADYLRSPDGDYGRYAIELATRVQNLAVEKVGYDDQKGPGRPDQGGGVNQEGGEQHLRDTIVKRIIQTNEGIVVQVGSSHPIALIHHEGTRAHEIRPRTAKVLAFEMGGNMVFATVVHHPGTQPNRYLTDSLAEVAAGR